MSKILIVEDEKHIADGLRFNLEAEGHKVVTVGDGESALEKLLPSARGKPSGGFDAVVLDVMLPGQDGFAVALKLREAGEYVPILMLTARGRSEDVLRGFESGADDYLPKPFELNILIARLRSLLRRKAWVKPELDVSALMPNQGAANAVVDERAAQADREAVTFAGRVFDFQRLELRVKKKTYPLTLMEAELLRYLVEREGVPVSRKDILENVWELHEDTDTRAIDNFIVRLRRYIEDDPAEPKHLVTVRGVGYKFVGKP